MLTRQEERRFVVEIFDNAPDLRASGVGQRPYRLTYPALGKSSRAQRAFAHQDSLQRLDKREIPDNSERDVLRRMPVRADAESAIAVEVASDEVSLQIAGQGGKSDRGGLARNNAVARQVRNHFARTDSELGKRHFLVNKLTHRMCAPEGSGKPHQMILVLRGKGENNVSLVSDTAIGGQKSEPVRLCLAVDGGEKA